MTFSYEKDNCIATNQLRGLINYGPIETYVNKAIRLAVLSPKECAADIWKHLQKLNEHHVTSLIQDANFLPEYTGFQNVFRCNLDIPNGNDVHRFKGYSIDKVMQLNAKSYFYGICKYIDAFETQRSQYDLLVIYIPKQF